uniref:Uncharacterized protein n=1 Tax=Micrurus surinamensis TaxID=129470 RepID=A0A2D4Q604_MICSU
MVPSLVMKCLQETAKFREHQGPLSHHCLPPPPPSETLLASGTDLIAWLAHEAPAGKTAELSEHQEASPLSPELQISFLPCLTSACMKQAKKGKMSRIPTGNCV